MGGREGEGGWGWKQRGPHLGVIANVVCSAHLEEDREVHDGEVGVVEVRGEDGKPPCYPSLPWDLQHPSLTVHVSTSDVAHELVQC